MSRRSRILQSPKVAQKKRKKLIITTFLSTFCVIIFIIFLVLLLRTDFLQISSIKVIGSKTIDISSIEQEALTSMNGYYLGLIPETSTFFYPRSKIEKILSDSFNKIDSLEIGHSGISGLEINIKEKDTAALVCDGFHDDSDSDQKCYSVDKDGFVFEQSPVFSDGVYPKYYVDMGENKEVIGTYFIDTEQFKKFQKFIKNIQDAHISTTGLLIGENDQYELYIKNKDLSDAVVYFDNRIPLEKTATNLILFLNDEMMKKNTATSTQNFDYINLRFGNNIFYVTK